MSNVNNKKIIMKLSFRSLQAAHLRNGMAICAITLTAVLFTTLFTLGIGSIDAIQLATMRQTGSSAHAVIKYIDDDTFEKITTHPLIKEISYNRILFDSIENPELLKRRGELWYKDDAGLRFDFCEPTVGNRPFAANEIIADTKTLQLLQIPQEIGAKVKLTLRIRNKLVERDFILSGWWESDPVYPVSMFITSKAYIDEHSDELAYTYKEDYSFSGLINANIMFANTFAMQQKLDRIITESGFDATNPESDAFLHSNLNWAYLSAKDSDPAMIATLIAALLLIMLTGYLIIYNIFQISVLRDIRYYGLLKTIGTTSRQIKRIIRRQAILLSCIGIPIGLTLGFVLGSTLVPLVLDQTYYAGTKVIISPNPLIFIGSAVFAAVTLWISVNKPGTIAAKVSPVEAVRFIDSDTSANQKKKKTTDGGKLYKMAFSNLTRNKKRTVLVLLSLSLSIVLLNCVFTISRGLDMDKYIATFVDTDFLVAHADYFNFTYYDATNSVDEPIIKTLEALPGFTEGGRLYSTKREYFTIEDSEFDKIYNRGQDGHPYAVVYGLDDLPLERLEVIEGELDIDKLKSGGYILEGVHTDDFNQPIWDSSNFAIGEKVVLHNNRLQADNPSETEYVTLEYEVMAKVLIKHYTNTNRSWNEYSFYLPANIYRPLTYEKAVMSYAFNTDDSSEAEVEFFLQNYTATEEPLMNYESKAVKINEFQGFRSVLLTIGSLLSGIIGFIGILNFINAILTSLLTRKCEFAILQSIGMTQKQLRNLLCLEGLYYAIGTILISFLLAVISSLFIVQGLVGGLWFFSYQFIILPLIACWIVFLILSVLIPSIAFSGTLKESVVTRLREIE